MADVMFDKVLKKYDVEVAVLVRVSIPGVMAINEEDARQIALDDSKNYLSLPGSGFTVDREVLSVRELPQL